MDYSWVPIKSFKTRTCPPQMNLLSSVCDTSLGAIYNAIEGSCGKCPAGTELIWHNHKLSCMCTNCGSPATVVSTNGHCPTCAPGASRCPGSAEASIRQIIGCPSMPPTNELCLKHCKSERGCTEGDAASYNGTACASGICCPGCGESRGKCAGPPS